LARSFEEFAVKKTRGATLKIPGNLYDRPFTKFFSWNGYETLDNHYPPDPHLVESLKSLEGVRTAVALLDINFSYPVHPIADEPKLRKLYEDSRSDPGPLGSRLRCALYK
jgi:hypothetical protein